VQRSSNLQLLAELHKMGYGDQAQAVLGATINELSNRKQQLRQMSPGDASVALSGDKSSLADNVSESLERQNDEMLMRILYNNLKLKKSSRGRGTRSAKKRRGSRYAQRRPRNKASAGRLDEENQENARRSGEIVDLTVENTSFKKPKASVSESPRNG
jgi:hypothetical protein